MLVGRNNCGISTLIHVFSVWEFYKMKWSIVQILMIAQTAHF